MSSIVEHAFETVNLQRVEYLARSDLRVVSEVVILSRSKNTPLPVGTWTAAKSNRMSIGIARMVSAPANAAG